MKWQLRSWFKKARWRYDRLAFFIPYATYNSTDLVQAAVQFWRRLRRPPIPFVVIDAMRPHVNDILSELNLAESPKWILIFAHPTEARNGFLVNPGQASSDKAILLRWWMRSGFSCEVLVVHVCHGSEILQRKSWQEHFPRWLSYERKLRAFLASSTGSQRWSEVYVGIGQAMSKASNLKETKRRIEAVYLDTMIRAWDGFDPVGGDALNLMYLEECLESMVTSEEI